MIFKEITEILLLSYLCLAFCVQLSFSFLYISIVFKKKLGSGKLLLFKMTLIVVEVMFQDITVHIGRLVNV
jgi:hypothetical protein